MSIQVVLPAKSHVTDFTHMLLYEWAYGFVDLKLTKMCAHSRGKGHSHRQLLTADLAFDLFVLEMDLQINKYFISLFECIHVLNNIE